MVEIGRHDELLRKGGRYASFYRLQFEQQAPLAAEGTVAARSRGSDILHKRLILLLRTTRPRARRGRVAVQAGFPMLRHAGFHAPAAIGPSANPLRNTKPASMPTLDGSTHGVSAVDPQRLPPPSERPRPAPELSIVVPTFNERENVPRLVDMLRAALPGIDWELIIVDDNSPDGTAEVAKHIAAADSRIRCMRRVGRRGLAGACLEGILASQAKYVAVMDGDLQHDERLLLPSWRCCATTPPTWWSPPAMPTAARPPGCRRNAPSAAGWRPGSPTIC